MLVWAAKRFEQRNFNVCVNDHRRMELSYRTAITIPMPEWTTDGGRRQEVKQVGSKWLASAIGASKCSGLCHRSYGIEHGAMSC